MGRCLNWTLNPKDKLLFSVEDLITKGSPDKSGLPEGSTKNKKPSRLLKRGLVTII